MTDSAAVERAGRGRPSNREKHRDVVRLSEEKIIQRFGDITDAALEMALGRKPESCRFHHLVLRCPHTTELETGEEVLDCAVESRGFPSNERMIIYAIDRIAGRPAAAGAEKQVQADFIRTTAQYVARIFSEANRLPDADERARTFAIGMANIWNFVESAE